MQQPSIDTSSGQYVAPQLQSPLGIMKMEQLTPWIQQRIQSPWSTMSLAPQLAHGGQEWLESVLALFRVLDAPCKSALLYAIFSIKERLFETTPSLKESLMNMLQQGKEDPDAWVRVLSVLLQEFPETGYLNLQLESKVAPFGEALSVLTELLEKRAPTFAPLECLYLSNRISKLLYPHYEPVKSPFQVKPLNLESRKQYLESLSRPALGNTFTGNVHLFHQHHTSASTAAVASTSSSSNTDNVNVNSNTLNNTAGLRRASSILYGKRSHPSSSAGSSGLSRPVPLVSATNAVTPPIRRPLSTAAPARRVMMLEIDQSLDMQRERQEAVQREEADRLKAVALERAKKRQEAEQRKQERQRELEERRLHREQLKLNKMVKLQHESGTSNTRLEEDAAQALFSLAPHPSTAPPSAALSSNQSTHDEMTELYSSLFSDANEALTLSAKERIISFVKGQVAAPADPTSEPIENIVMRETEIVENGRMGYELIVFEMNHQTGLWRKLRRKKFKKMN